MQCGVHEMDARKEGRGLEQMPNAMPTRWPLGPARQSEEFGGRIGQLAAAIAPASDVAPFLQPHSFGTVLMSDTKCKALRQESASQTFQHVADIDKGADNAGNTVVLPPDKV